jgi:hypothetical protein
MMVDGGSLSGVITGQSVAATNTSPSWCAGFSNTDQAPGLRSNRKTYRRNGPSVRENTARLGTDY